MNYIIRKKISRSIIYPFLLMLLAVGTLVGNAISTELTEEDTNPLTTKKRKLQDEISDVSLNDENFTLAYKLIKSDITPTYNSGKLDSFLVELGDTLAKRIIAKLIEENGSEYFSPSSSTPTPYNSSFSAHNSLSLVEKFLNNRKNETFHFNKLEEINNAIRIGYIKFSFKPNSKMLNEVLTSLALSKKIVSGRDKTIKSFIFEMPELEGKAERGQFKSFIGLPRNFSFSPPCLNLSNIDSSLLKEFLLNEIVQVFMSNQVSSNLLHLKLDGMDLTDDYAEIISNFVEKNSTFASLSLDNNEFTSTGFKKLLNALKMNNGRISEVSLRGNKISDTQELIKMFTSTVVKSPNSSTFPYHAGRYGASDTYGQDSYQYSKLRKLDLSNNPFEIGQIAHLLKGFRRTFGDRVTPSPSPSQYFFSITELVLRGISSIKEMPQQDKGNLSEMMSEINVNFKLSMDEEFSST